MSTDILDIAKLEEHQVLNLVLIEFESLGQSRKQLADICGVPYKTFSAALTGRGYIGMDAWMNIMTHTGTKIPQVWAEKRGFHLTPKK